MPKHIKALAGRRPPQLPTDHSDKRMRAHYGLPGLGCASAQTSTTGSVRRRSSQAGGSSAWPVSMRSLWRCAPRAQTGRVAESVDDPGPEPVDLVREILSPEPSPTGTLEEPAPNAAMGFVGLLLWPLILRLRRKG